MIPPDKAGLRLRMRGLLASLPEAELADQSQRLGAFLREWAAAQGFEDVLATIPLPGELDLAPFLRFWLRRGRLALARTAVGRRLDFGYVDYLEGPWKTKPFGLQEPDADAPAWRAGSRTLVLVPGLAFAPAPAGGGLRLGQGGGYFDRWLEENARSVFTLGIGLSIQTLATVPVEAHDKTLNAWWDGTSLRS